MADEFVKLELSEHGAKCLARLQEVVAEFDLSATDGVLACGELLAWAHLLGFMVVGKDRMMIQVDQSCASVRAYVEDNFEGYKARMEVFASLESGESGGRLQ